MTKEAADILKDKIYEALVSFGRWTLKAAVMGCFYLAALIYGKFEEQQKQIEILINELQVMNIDRTHMKEEYDRLEIVLKEITNGTHPITADRYALQAQKDLNSQECAGIELVEHN